jgi:hypothetical protein
MEENKILNSLLFCVNKHHPGKVEVNIISKEGWEKNKELADLSTKQKKALNPLLIHLKLKRAIGCIYRYNGKHSVPVLEKLLLDSGLKKDNLFTEYIKNFY